MFGAKSSHCISLLLVLDVQKIGVCSTGDFLNPLTEPRLNTEIPNQDLIKKFCLFLWKWECVCVHMCDTINPLQHYLSISHDKKRRKSKFKNSWQHTKSNKKHKRKGRNITWHYSIKKALLFVKNKYSYTLSEAKTSHTNFWNKSTFFLKWLMLFLWRSLFLQMLTILLLTYLPS